MQLLLQQQCSQHLNRHDIGLQDAIMKLLLRKLRPDGLASQLRELQRAEHVPGLVQRGITPV